MHALGTLLTVLVLLMQCVFTVSGHGVPRLLVTCFGHAFDIGPTFDIVYAHTFHCKSGACIGHTLDIGRTVNIARAHNLLGAHRILCACIYHTFVIDGSFWT